ncbi:DUF1513 domain-containing protein [Roseobacter sp. S98]|uniref:DUF1513 domain-containing protein n=1 Tax=Roseobacter algicola (ex Choi et al. 2025) (nom. illeg.) TaxID=3092138 RepID=UPI0035C7515F
MKGRRHFLAGLIAAGLLPRPTWADAGSPAFLSAAAKPDGRYVLCGISDDLQVLFQIPLPGRGHAAAAHPTKPEAVAFARRPGTFAVVIDCASRRQSARLDAPPGRHFYGHGTYSSDGSLLFTTENDYEAGQGRIGVWDVLRDYKRTDEWSSGGIGPHDIRRLPHSDLLVVANGGIDTHPDSGRTKLNIPTMRPNLAYVENGGLTEVAELPPDQHRNSIRHLAVSTAGDVAFGMQWQGAGTPVSLVGTHRQGARLLLTSAPEDKLRELNGYVGSIAYSEDGRTIAVTSPRGGRAHLYRTHDMQLSQSVSYDEVSGVAQTSNGLLLTSGEGSMALLQKRQFRKRAPAGLMWDNHLVALDDRVAG